MSLYDDIQALPIELRQSQDTQAIADALSAGRTRYRKTEAGFGTILSTIGPVDGAALLDTLAAIKTSNRPLYWAWYLLERGVFDFGTAATQAQMDALVSAGVLSADNAARLKALGVEPDPVDEMDVRRLCWSSDGGWLV